MRRSLRFPVLLPMSIVALLLAACQAASPTPSGTTVEVTLQEWSVVPAEDSAPAGDITFEVTNSGAEMHEFVIIRTDTPPGDLEVDENGAVTEGGEGMTVISEIEDIEAGETMSVTADLEAGAYVLLCNIYTADEDEAHYAMGMRTAFTVE